MEDIRRPFGGTSAQVVAVILAILVAAVLALPRQARGDSSKVLTLGADLSDTERATVLESFGLTESDLSQMKVIEVTNAQERQYLEGVLSDDVIGYETLSCSYIQPKTSGGIHIRTGNLTYVTQTSLYNALQTAGVENVDLVVTAPYPVSGTGALTGVFLAYESDGVTLDESKKEAATEELITTSDMEQTYGEDVSEVVSTVKNEVASSGDELTDDQIRELIRSAADEKGLDISDEDIERIVEIAKRVQELGYDGQSFASTLSQFRDKLGSTISETDAEGILGTVANWFEGVIRWFKGLLGMDDGSSTDAGSVFDGLDTSTFGSSSNALATSR